MKNKVLVKTPNTISRDIKLACQKVLPQGNLLFVEKVDFAEGIINKCPINTKKYVENFGGEIVFGWEVTYWKNVLLELIGHSIVRNNDELICVTPSKYGNKRILFLEDSKLSFDYFSCNSRLPSKYIPLNSSNMVENLISTENRIYEIKCKYPITSGNILVRGNDAIELSYLEKERESLTKKIRVLYK